jgi:hypothetical protein
VLIVVKVTKRKGLKGISELNANVPNIFW